MRGACKCGAALSEDEWSDDHADGTPCPLVACDREDCRAKENPVTLDELRAAYEHWRSHPRLHGCSHGR
jgi:hypothetical protein